MNKCPELSLAILGRFVCGDGAKALIACLAILIGHASTAHSQSVSTGGLLRLSGAGGSELFLSQGTASGELELAPNSTYILRMDLFASAGGGGVFGTVDSVSAFALQLGFTSTPSFSTLGLIRARATNGQAPAIGPIERVAGIGFGAFTVVSSGTAFNFDGSFISSNFGLAAFSAHEELPNAFLFSGLTRGFTSGRSPGGGSGIMELAWSVQVGVPTTVTYSAAITNPPVGASQQVPILPSFVHENTFTFSDVQSGQWVDPPSAYGFEYQMTDGSKFTSIMDFPTGFAEKFTITTGGMVLGAFGPGEAVDFSGLPGGGVSSFRVTGIDPTVDPENPTAFPLRLSFDTASADFTMSPISVPEPRSTSLLLVVVFFALGCWRSRRSQAIGEM